MGIFGKLAYEQGATVGTLLAVRFVLAAALFWGLVLATGAARRLRTLPRRDIGLALALGAVGYSAQAGAYFVALERLDASLLSLLLYTFPAMVTVAAIALGRERASRRKAGALVLASGGLVLVLAGAGAGALDPVGALLGITAAVVYTTYILTSAGRRRARRPAAAQRAGLHRRGDDADDRHRRRRATCTRAHLTATGFGWLRPSRSSRRWAPSACSSPGSSASARRPPRSSRRPSR